MPLVAPAIQQKDCIPISVKTLDPERATGLTLYLKDAVDGRFVLYREADVPLELDDFAKLLNRGITRLYLKSSDHQQYQQYLRENLGTILHDESVSVQRRCASLNEVVRDVLADAFQQKSTNTAVDVAHELAVDSVDLICRDDVVAGDLMNVMYHDYHTFTHSANVSMYCVLLARALGISDQTHLREITTGGLLHDLGKLEIPDAILTKPARLSDEEFDAIREHPRSGFLKLCHRTDLNFAQLMMVYQHHERLDGRGYPVGAATPEIHDWARICTVADVFEALTSNRPYRPALSIAHAFEIMDRDCGTAFDSEMLKCWKKTILSK